MHNMHNMDPDLSGSDLVLSRVRRGRSSIFGRSTCNVCFQSKLTKPGSAQFQTVSKNGSKVDALVSHQNVDKCVRLRWSDSNNSSSCARRQCEVR